MTRIETSSGVLKKIRSQIDSLKKEGVEVFIAAGYGDPQTVSAKKMFEELFKGIDIRYCHIEYSAKVKIINKLKFIKSFYKMLRFIGKDIRPDIYYFRGLTAERNLLRFVKSNDRKVVFEVNTLIREEYILRKAYSKLILNYLYSRPILKHSAGCVTVTDEIADSLKRVGGQNLLTKTVSNGIDVHSYPLAHERVRGEKELNLIFVGHIAEWHGLDRILEGMARYTGEYEVKLTIVGNGTDLEKYKEFVLENKLDKKVLFYGELTCDELNPLFDDSDIGISTLALHRKRMKETSALKNREYCSRGMPFILSDVDVDIKNEIEIAQYFLKVLPDDSAIDINEIIRFYHQIEKKEYKLQIRNFAENKLSMKAKMSELYQFLLYLLMK